MVFMFKYLLVVIHIISALHRVVFRILTPKCSTHDTPLLGEEGTTYYFILLKPGEQTFFVCFKSCHCLIHGQPHVLTSYFSVTETNTMVSSASLIYTTYVNKIKTLRCIINNNIATVYKYLYLTQCYKLERVTEKIID